MCGIIGVIHADPESNSAAADIHDALYLLQHRGQDACGVVTCAPGGRIYQCKGRGMASKVFHDGEKVSGLLGSMGLGHLRYPTAAISSNANAEAQPFYVNSPYGICFAHNGNLINAVELKRFLDQEAHRHVNTDSDSELMLSIFANELSETRKARVNPDDCFASLERTYNRCKGGWACAAMIAGFGLLAFRDPYGIRPLAIGKRTLPGQGTDWMVASESVALKFFGCHPEDIQDIMPGQAVIIEKGKEPRFHQVQEAFAYAPDIFEYVYFARPDSAIDGISVYASRRNMGAKLGAKIISQLSAKELSEIDIVVPIPETSNTAARCVAEALQKPLVDGFVKNRYIFRTFIMPSQKLRRTGVRRKLNAIDSEFAGKNVLLVDDSIVRGNTSKEIVSVTREAGSKKVYFCSCAPPITNVHIYGIDLASTNELIAYHKSPQEIADEIGADAVIYQSLADLEAACAELSPRGKQSKFEVGVFNGNYITPVDEQYIDYLNAAREGAKKKKKSTKQPEMNPTPRIGPSSCQMAGAVQNGNGAAAHQAAQTPQDEVAQEALARSMQDISLYNFNDHER